MTGKMAMTGKATTTMSSLFRKVSDIRTGQVWIDVEMTENGSLHPMKKVKVKEVDDVGMVIIHPAIYGAESQGTPVSVDTFREKYRLEE